MINPILTRNKEGVFSQIQTNQTHYQYLIEWILIQYLYKTDL